MRMYYSGRSGNIDETDIRGSLYNHQVMMRLLPYLGPHKKIVAVATAAMLVYTGSLVVFPWLIALAFAAVVDGELGRLTWILLAMGINALAGWAFNYVQLVLMARVGQNVLYNLRMDLFRHLQSLSLSFYDRNEVGRIMSRMQNDIIQLQEFLTTGILVFGDMLVLGGIIGAMLLMDVQLALVTLAVLPLLFLLLYYWQQFARRAYLRVRRAIAAVNASLQENIAGIRVVQSMGREDINLQKFNRLNGRNLEHQPRRQPTLLRRPPRRRDYQRPRPRSRHRLRRQPRPRRRPAHRGPRRLRHVHPAFLRTRAKPHHAIHGSPAGYGLRRRRI